MSVLTMQPRDEVFVISESNGTRSRDTITFSAALTVELPAGTILDALTSEAGDLVYQAAVYDATGHQVPADAVLLRHAPIGSTHGAALTRDAEVDASGLIWPSGTDVAGEKFGLTMLASNGIIVR